MPGLPRYGVVLTETTAKIPPKWASPNTVVTVSNVSVDSQTGKQVALIEHPANVTFTGVSGAADDRTFVVAGAYFVPTPLPGVQGDMEDIQVFYLLRINPGSARPTTLTRLGITALPSATLINGLALSPDGQTLAVLEWRERNAPEVVALQLYSVATGKAERAWTGGLPPASISGYGDAFGYGDNFTGLTWLTGGRTLAFTYYAKGQAPAVRTLDTTLPGTGLLAGSQRVFALPVTGPDACAQAVLTADGRTVVCGTQQSSITGCNGANAGTTEALEIDEYSAATGKREPVLYLHTARCAPNGIGALGWVGPGGTLVAAVDPGSAQQGILSTQDDEVVAVLTEDAAIPLLSATLPIRWGMGAIAF